jgi:MoaA/NifB/PqqE/SkfB family radical SAM enzyme
MASLNVFQWLRYGPWLAQVVVTRRCNLTCGYCTEYDRTSDPVPYDDLASRLAKLSELRTWAVCLTGGEPTMHPRLPDLVAEMKRLGFKRRMMITNGTRLTPKLIGALNDAGLTDMQISVDGVKPNDVTIKTLKPLRKKLELLAKKATFRVVMSGVIGSAPPEEALEVVDFAKAHGFTPRVLLLHDQDGQLRLSRQELIAYAEAKRRIGERANEARGYRGKMIESGKASFKCRSGSRYLYVDEFGSVHWCYQTREAFSKDLLAYTYADLREQFDTKKDCSTRCTIGCARTASATDEWRPQRGLSAAAEKRPALPERPLTLESESRGNHRRW